LNGLLASEVSYFGKEAVENVMNREAPSAPRELANREEALIPLNDEAVLAEEMDSRHRQERRVARLRLLWSNRGLLLKCVACGMAVGLLIALLIPARYESTTRLMPPDGQQGTGIAGMLSAFAGGGGGGGATALEGLAGNVLGVKTSGDLFIGVLQSRTVRDDLITKFNLRKLYWDRRWEDARRDLAKNTDLSEDKKSGIIAIRVTDRSPQRAAAMAREYVDELNWVMTQLNTSSAHRERVFLEERLGQVKQDLGRAEKDFSEFASKNMALDVPAQGKAMVEAAGSLEGELIAAQTELQGLKQIYTDSNVRVRSTQARVDELNRQLHKMGGNAGKPDDQSMYPSIRQLPLLGVTYADLLRRTKIQEAIFETLTQEYELAKVQEVKEIPSVKVLDPPDIPEKKSFPPRAQITVLGGLFASMLFILWILGSHAWHEADPHDPATAFAQEVVSDVRGRFARFSANGAAEAGPKDRTKEAATNRLSL